MVQMRITDCNEVCTPCWSNEYECECV